MNIKDKYPKLFAKLDDSDMELRHLLNVDENYEDYDSEEYDFDHEDYNFVIYISENIQNALNEEKMSELMVKLHDNAVFENFLASEMDLYGVKTNINEEAICQLILEEVEKLV